MNLRARLETIGRRLGKDRATIPAVWTLAILLAPDGGRWYVPRVSESGGPVLWGGRPKPLEQDPASMMPPGRILHVETIHLPTDIDPADVILGYVGRGGWNASADVFPDEASGLPCPVAAELAERYHVIRHAERAGIILMDVRFLEPLP